MATTTDMDKLLASDGAGVASYRLGETVKGIVIDANPSRILLDLEGGVTGIITKKEATGFGMEDEIQEGAELEAVVINDENEQGLVVLSLRKANQDMVWAELNTFQDEARIIVVKVDNANKGGLIAFYKGIKCFLPVSQLTPLNYPRVDGADSGMILDKLQKHVGKEFAVRIINVDRENGKVIISEKGAVAEKTKETLKNLNNGDVVKGKVSGVVKYGIFVTFGGVEGLVHLSELDWGHVSDPGKHYSVGDEVEVMVIGVDGTKLSFSIKQLSEDPWLKSIEGYDAGQKVSGKVVRWNPQGVFIEIKPNVQGFFALEQFGVESHGDLEIKEGDELKGTITEINTSSHRIHLQKA